MTYCNMIMESITGLSPKFNVYDIREECTYPPLCYDFSAVDNLLNDADVQRILGVSGRGWKECNMLVHTWLLGDWMVNLLPQVADMLDNTDLQVLVYSGDQDFICNWRGGEAWTNNTTWKN